MGPSNANYSQLLLLFLLFLPPVLSMSKVSNIEEENATSGVAPFGAVVFLCDFWSPFIFSTNPEVW